MRTEGVWCTEMGVKCSTVQMSSFLLAAPAHCASLPDDPTAMILCPRFLPSCILVESLSIIHSQPPPIC